MTIDRVFSLPDFFKYPSDNHECFEDFFLRTFKQDGMPREFLPVAWTSFYRRAGYGKDQGMLRRLQKEVLNKLDRSKKYFTVVTWDDGIVNDLSDLDIQVFAACGPRIDFPIPLLCQPHNYREAPGKDILCSFVGALNHDIRKKIVTRMTGLGGYYVSAAPHDLRKYCDILSRSRYVMCPRGYGMTSFRICEAIQYKAIPIYISDQFAYARGTVNVTVANDDFVSTIKQVVNMNILPAHSSHDFSFEACRELILKNVRP